MSKDVMAVFGALIGAIVLFTLLGGGDVHLGTAPTGPYFNLGFKGPQAK